MILHFGVSWLLFGLYKGLTITWEGRYLLKYYIFSFVRVAHFYLWIQATPYELKGWRFQICGFRSWLLFYVLGFVNSEPKLVIFCVTIASSPKEGSQHQPFSHSWSALSLSFLRWCVPLWGWPTPLSLAPPVTYHRWAGSSLPFPSGGDNTKNDCGSPPLVQQEGDQQKTPLHEAAVLYYHFIPIGSSPTVFATSAN